MFHALAGLLDLLPQYLFVDRHNQHVIEIEFLTGMHQHTNNVRQIVQLVLGEELVMQIEGAKDHVDDGHVALVAAVERVVTHRDIRAGRIQNAELMQAPGAVHVRQEIIEELKIALAIEDHHRQAMGIVWGADHSCQVLRNDVLEKRGLAGAGHAQHDALHHTYSVGPVPWLAVDVLTQDHGILFPRVGRKLLVPWARYNHRRMGPLSLPPRSRGNNKDSGPGDRQSDQGQVGTLVRRFGGFPDRNARALRTRRTSTPPSRSEQPRFPCSLAMADSAAGGGTSRASLFIGSHRHLYDS